MDQSVSKTESTISHDVTSEKGSKKGSGSHRSSGVSLGHTLKWLVKTGSSHNSKHRATVDSKAGAASAEKQSELEPNPARPSS